MRRIGGSVRVAARLGVIASILALASVLAGCVVGVPAFGAVRSGGLLGSPLVVPSAESFLGGQQAADEAARRANPAAVAARLRSRTAFAHLPGAQVGGLLGKAFPGAIHRPAGGTPPLPSGAHVVGYPSAHAIQLSLPGHQIGILESTAPVAKRSSHGHFAPINLAVTATGGGFAPANSDVTVTIPRALSSGVGTPQNGVTLTPVDPRGRGLVARGGVVGSSVVYPNTQSATDTVVKPTPTGFQLDAVLRSIDSPQQLYFRLGAPAGAKLVQDAASGVVRVLLKGATLATILPPSARDAAGTAVPSSMSVVGHTVVVSVQHRAGSYLYPIYVDPEINDSQLVEATGGKRSNWEFKSSNEAKFGHKAVYEGAGKEHLEASGTAEYVATEFAYWAYETKGNSKIYELKTKTSAKNKLAKIESFLEFRYSGGAESKKLLSTEGSEPEYSEKVSTICSWNASKVEECLPASGKEKNVVRFQQSATEKPGANFKFSDTMSEGIVSISEPAEEHSTTKFNTASPEVEGEVEGKMQKRVNALYGSGIWLTKSKGALQLIAKDPGIGVSATRLEYEKSAGSWETLSSHNYLETEHACQGVQCYAEHAEYWTADPKLPDGEDKIRYRAEEAISGTVSPSGEEASTKTVKVDTAKPHGLYLSGLPYGNELSEKSYALTAGAADGVGSTVASSGIKSIAFYIEGSLIGINGGTGGAEGSEGKCSVAKGECSATAKWSINGAELGAGHHAIVIVATDNAGNEERIEETISIRHSTPVAIGPGSVDLQSGDFALGASDVAMGSGLNVARNYSSRALDAGDEGPLGPQWSLNLGTTESIVEMVDKSVLLTDSNGAQVIFAALEGGKFESPTGDSNLTLRLEENEAKVKLAYYLEDATKHTKTKFTLPSGSSKTWVPSKQEGTVATDTLTYAFRAVEARDEFRVAPGSEGIPYGIVAGPDGNVWFTDYHHIGKINHAGVVTEYPLPTGGGAESIAVGSDGNLWFDRGSNASNHGKIGKITPSGTVTEYTLPEEYAPSGGLALGSDGNIWFRLFNKIGKITPSGTVTEYSVGAESFPRGITNGPDGNLWFTVGKKIGKITTSGTVTEYTMPEWVKNTVEIVSGPDGNLWFTSESTESKIGKITTTGAVTGYALTAGVKATDITEGPDGNLWFVAPGNDKVGKITTGGTVTEYAQATGAEPVRITSGSDGKLWFSNQGTRRIGTMTTSGSPVTEPTEVLAPVPTGVSCSPMKQGCRALKFVYAAATTVSIWGSGDNQSEWGAYRGRLEKTLMDAYNPSSKEMQETAVAEYSYDRYGRLRSEWDPRVSPALKTTYGYDAEGHVTALSPPGQESWAFTYGTVAGDSGTGRLLKVARAPASESLWSGENVKSTEAPSISGTPEVGIRLAVSDGKWSGGPIGYAYQWEDCNSAGEACTPIASANNANYTPVAGDVGHKLVAVVTATNGGGSLVTASGASAVVAEAEGETGSPTITAYSVPSEGEPEGITAGPDGNMWFSEYNAEKVGKITTGGTVTEYAAGLYEGKGITTGPDGKMWFVGTSGLSGKVNDVTTSGTLATHTMLRTFPLNQDVVTGPDGKLWVTEYNTNYIAKMKTNGEIVAEYALPASSRPEWITVGPDGKLWFTEVGTDKIGKITTSGTITEYALPGGSWAASIAAGPDGNLWFVETNRDKVGKITTSGTITEYSLPSGSEPNGIASGPGGNLWFTNYWSKKVGKITTSGTITEYSLPAGNSGPVGIAAGPGKTVWFAEPEKNKIAKLDPKYSYTEGEIRQPSAGYAIEYGVPLSGTGLPNLTSSEVAKWGQSDNPVEATAILPPDARQGWPASSYTRAGIYYLDDQGRSVNVESPSTATYGSISTTEYNEFNDVVRTLSPDNRQSALEAGGESVSVAKLLSTYYTYREECSTEAENKHEAESEAPGARLCETEGPQHEVKYIAGGKQEEALARLHTKYFYDENSPGGAVYNLATKTSTLAHLANEEEVEVRKTTTSYSGQSNLGWTLRAPTSVTVDPEGKKLTTTTLYNSATAQITETRSPAGSGGESPHDTKLIYYSAEANTEGYSACGSHAEWAGLVCETLPAKQPSSGPKLPVTTTTYNIWNEPEVTTETFGSTVRTKKHVYDGAGRLTESETTSSANTALPKVTYEYDSKTGVLEKRNTTVEGKTQTITSKYSKLGQLTEYTDADGNIAKYVYGGPENDWLLEEMTDGSNAGTGRQTYSYDAKTKQMEELWDSAAGIFTATYDAEGKLTSEIYPNAMCANDTYNSVGEATHIEYIKTTNCAEHEASVWYSETRNPSVRGETFSRTSTLASEKYMYDSVGRLTEAQETPAGEGCSVRLYAYDEESNRTSQTTRTPGGGGKCATEGGTVLEHTYDEGNRLSDTGVAYDSFGNLTKVPSADAEGHELSSTFYVDNAVATQTQNGVTNNYYVDPEGRVRETVSGANSTITHYDGSGEAVAWTSESGGKSTRNIPGIDGSLSATQANGGTPILQLHDLQGDVVATAALSTTETKVLSTYNSTEFGVPNAEKAPPKFAWLGASDVASAFSSGVITYGATSYVPQIGRSLQSEAVDPPGAPGGTGAGAQYNSQLEPWVFQGAAAEAAEAPGLEAAREQAALEAAWAAATDPLQVHYMNKTKARGLAAKLWYLSKAAEVADALDVPLGWVEAAVGVVGKIAVSTAVDWLVRTSEMMWKCGNSKWSIAGVKANICKIEYSVLDVAGTDFVDFTKRANVFVCMGNSGGSCFHQVFPDPPPEEVKCAFGLFCIAVAF